MPASQPSQSSLLTTQVAETGLLTLPDVTRPASGVTDALSLNRASSLLFVDSQVGDYQQLVSGARSGTEVYVLDPLQDVVSQITQTLLGKTGISSLHILSHGEAGGLDFGSGTFNLSTLSSSASQVQSWSQALTDDADILLYGCNVAQGELGQAFVSILSSLSGADVAASDDLTGASGDWTLEFQTGQIESGLAIAQSTLGAYQHTLAEGDVVWAKTFGGTGSDTGEAVATDSSGNLYLSGEFSGSALFGSTTLTSNGGRDVLVTKLDSTGAVLWATGFGGSDYDEAAAIAIDSNGNLYVTGRFASSSLTIGSTTLTNQGFEDIYAVKLNGSDGSLVWAKSFGGTSNDYSLGIATDSSGNAYLTGYFDSSSLTVGNTTLTKTGTSSDIFAIKLASSDGSVAWAKSFGGSGNDKGYDVATDSSGSAYLTGFFSGTATFGSTSLTSSGTSDTYVVKLNNSDGSVTWAKNFGSSGNDNGSGIATDSSGNSLVTGSRASDTFVMKLDPTGNAVWEKTFSNGTYSFGSDIATDSRGNAYVTGMFYGNPIAIGSITLTNVRQDDLFAFKLNGSDGSAVWAVGLGGSSGESGNGIAVDRTGNAYITGYFGSPSATIGSITLRNNGSTSGDIPLIKVEGSAVPTIPTVPTSSDSSKLKDFNRDGKPDFVWHNSTTGENALWLLDGSTVLRTLPVPTIVDTNWELDGTDDFNGDGNPDLLWRNRANGGTTVWLMNGNMVVADLALPSLADLNWNIAAIADFNGDGQADLWWHNAANGDNALWLVNDGLLTEAIIVPNIRDTNWQLADVGDFDNNGSIDLLWRNGANGGNTLWLMQGTTLVATSALAEIRDTNWTLAAVGDLDGDGQLDLVWRNQANGENTVWQLRDATVVATSALAPIHDTNWQVASLSDLDDDGKLDIVWRNQANRSNVAWKLDNTTVQQVYDLPTIADPNWEI